MSKYMVSVIIPVYNRAQLVVRTLQSVLAQSLSPIEVILVDNNSSDDTIDVLQAFKRQHCSSTFNVTVAQEKRQGAARARNLGATMASGEWLGAFGLTEPNAGTDASAQQTTAVLEDEEWVLNGSKIFITNGGKAHVYVIIAMTDKSLGNKGISAFIVEAGTPGFEIGKKELKMGIRGSATTELIFTNCRIPKANLLGKVGNGFAIAMKTLDGGRIGIAAQALGIAQGAMDETVKYTKERKQFGKAIGKFQNTQFQMADLQTKVQAARLLVRSAAFKKDQGVPYSADAAMAKLFAAETAMEVTTKAVQFHGGYGYTREYPVERMMRDAKITEIYEGTSEVQRMVIAANLYK